MNQKTLRLSTDAAAFLLDLPEGTAIVGAEVVDGVLRLQVITEHDFPEDAVLIYEADEFANIALTGAVPAE